MAQTAYELLVKIMGDTTSLNTALKGADEQTKASFGAMQQYSQGAAVALGGIALASGLVVKSMLDQAAQMEVYRTKLTTVFHDSAKAAETMAWAVKFAASTPFEVKGIVDATVTLSVYRQKATEILPLVGDLAAAMGARIEDTANAVGKAMGGSLEGWEMLRTSYGVTIERLKAFGAAIDGQGQMLTKNASDLDRNRKALLAVIATDFGGGMERQSKTFSGAMSNLSDAINNFKVGIGETLIPAATTAAKGLTDIIEKVKALPAPLKAAAGVGLIATTAITGLGAGVLGLLSVLGPGAAMLITLAEGTKVVAATAAFAGTEIKGFAAATTVLKGALASTSAALMGWGALAIGAAVAIKFVQDEWIKAAEAQDKLTASTSKNIAVSRESVQWIGKTGEELRKMGVALADIPKAMDGFRELAKAALEIGRTDLAKKYMDQARGVRDAGAALSDYNKKVDENFKLSGDAAKLAEHNAKIGLASARDMLSAEDAKLSAMRAYGATSDEIWAQEEKVYALRKKAEDEEKKAADDTAKTHQDAADKKLAASLHFIDRQISLNKMSEVEQIAAYTRIFAHVKLTREQEIELHNRMEDAARARRVRQEKEAIDSFKRQLDAEVAIGKISIAAAEAKMRAFLASRKWLSDNEKTLTDGATDYHSKAIQKQQDDFVKAEDEKLKQATLKASLIVASTKQASADAKKAEIDALDGVIKEYEKYPAKNQAILDKIVKLKEDKAKAGADAVKLGYEAELEHAKISAKGQIDEELKILKALQSKITLQATLLELEGKRQIRAGNTVEGEATLAQAAVLKQSLAELDKTIGTQEYHAWNEQRMRKQKEEDADFEYRKRMRIADAKNAEEANAIEVIANAEKADILEKRRREDASARNRFAKDPGAAKALYDEEQELASRITGLRQANAEQYQKMAQEQESQNYKYFKEGIDRKRQDLDNSIAKEKADAERRKASAIEMGQLEIGWTKMRVEALHAERAALEEFAKAHPKRAEEIRNSIISIDAELKKLGVNIYDQIGKSSVAIIDAEKAQAIKEVEAALKPLQDAISKLEGTMPGEFRSGESAPAREKRRKEESADRRTLVDKEIGTENDLDAKKRQAEWEVRWRETQGLPDAAKAQAALTTEFQKRAEKEESELAMKRIAMLEKLGIATKEDFESTIKYVKARAAGNQEAEASTKALLDESITYFSSEIDRCKAAGVAYNDLQKQLYALNEERKKLYGRYSPLPQDQPNIPSQGVDQKTTGAGGVDLSRPSASSPATGTDGAPSTIDDMIKSGPTYSQSAPPYASTPAPPSSEQRQRDDTQKTQLSATEKNTDATLSLAEQNKRAADEMKSHPFGIEGGGGGGMGGGGYGGGGRGGSQYFPDQMGGAAGNDARGDDLVGDVIYERGPGGGIAIGADGKPIVKGYHEKQRNPAAQQKKEEQKGPVRMDVNVGHVPGAQSIYEVEKSTAGGAGYWEGRGATRSAPAMPTQPQGNLNVTINVPERADAQTIAGRVISTVRNTAPALGFANQIGQGQ